jgi:hypothetical protein
LQLAGGSAKDAQAQLGHAQITTTLGIYTIPVPAHQREAVEKRSQIVTSWRSFENSEWSKPHCCSEVDGGRYRIRTYYFHRVKFAFEHTNPLLVLPFRKFQSQKSMPKPGSFGDELVTSFRMGSESLVNASEPRPPLQLWSNLIT